MDPLTLTTLVTASGGDALKLFLEKVRRDVSEDIEERQHSLLDDDEDDATPPPAV